MNFADRCGALDVLDPSDEQCLARAGTTARIECFLRHLPMLLFLPLGVASDQDLKVVLGDLGAIVRDISDLFAGDDFTGQNIAEVLSSTDVNGSAVSVTTTDNRVPMNCVVRRRGQPMN